MNVFGDIENDLDTDLFNTPMSIEDDQLLDGPDTFNIHIMDTLNNAALKGLFFCYPIHLFCN